MPTDVESTPVEATEVKSVKLASSSNWNGTKTTLSILGGVALIGGGLALGGGGGGKSSAPATTANTNANTNTDLASANSSTSAIPPNRITPSQVAEKPSNSAIADNPMGEASLHSSAIQTTIYFPNGQSVLHHSKEAIDLNQLQYKVVSAPLAAQNEAEIVIYIDKAHPAFQGLLAGAQAYVAGLSSKEIQAKIEAAYQIDSDGDGVIDLLDRDPNLWNVSERDLRIFSTLAYENKQDLTTAFLGSGNPKALHSYKDGQYKVGKVDAENMDLEALTKHWDLIEFGNPGSGLQYTIFGNGKNTLGEYQNIVVAFRGTEILSVNDISADLKIYDGRIPTQASYLTEIANKIASYNPDNVYSTGHSLGGYLAQYFAAHTMQTKPEWQQNFTHSALFNPVPLPNEKHTATARELSDLFTLTPVEGETFNQTNSYVIKGEFVSDGAFLAGAGIAVAETAKGGLWGTLLGTVGGLLAAPLTGGASVVASILAGATAGVTSGAVVGASNGIINGGKAIEGLGYYENSTLFDFKQGDFWGQHSLSSFFEKDLKLKTYFSNGYRMDNHYLADDADFDGLTDYQEARIGTSVYLFDSDNDGIIDGIEIKLGANALNGDETPWAVTTAETHFDDTPLMMFAEVTDENGMQLKGIVLTPTQTGDGVLYQATQVVEINEAFSPALFLDTEHLSDNAFSTLNGTAGDDIFILGDLNAVINGGEGSDRFVFQQIKEGVISYLNDFDLTKDKLVFNAEVFNDLKGFTYSQSQGQLFYNDIHYATVEQGLAITAEQITFI